MEENRVKPDCQEELNLFQLLKEKVFVDWNQLNEWEKKFIEMPVGDVFPLLQTGVFLEIKGLSNLMVKAFALQIQGKPEEEIRKTFNMTGPKWTPEELQKFKDETAWAFEAKKLRFFYYLQNTLVNSVCMKKFILKSEVLPESSTEIKPKNISHFLSSPF